jgi:hypothetical protein
MARTVGAKNKISGQAKENIAAVFVRLGGTAAMAKWAKKNETEFYKLYGRLLPLEHAGNADEPLIVVVRRFGAEPAAGQPSK